MARKNSTQKGSWQRDRPGEGGVWARAKARNRRKWEEHLTWNELLKEKMTKAGSNRKRKSKGLKREGRGTKGDPGVVWSWRGS